MEEDTKIINFLEEQIKKLSPQMKEAITESNWFERLKTIGERNNLNEEDINKLRTQLLLVFLGGIHPLDLFEKIKVDLNLNQEKTISLVNDINDLIIIKIINYAKNKNAPELEEKELNDGEKEGMRLLFEKINEEEEKKEKEIPEGAIILAEIYKDKPKIIQDFLVDNEYLKKLKEIGEKFKLKEEELSKIEDELIITFVFDRKKEEMVESLKIKINNLEENLFTELIKTIEEKILDPINSKKNEILNNFKESLGKSGLIKEKSNL